MTKAAHLAAPWFYSATQLKRADSCIRAWAWEKICGFESPPGAAALFGVEVHDVLQLWLSQGKGLNQFKPSGRVAFAGLDWLPPPGPELEVEREFRMKVGDFHYRGFVDLGFVNSDGVPWVIDHKTTRDFMWQLSVDDLRNDVQALLYAKEAIDRHDTDRVHLRWVYYLTQEPHRSRVTEVTMSRHDIDCRWPFIDELAREVDKVRLTVLNPLDLPPNANACAAYGGCPHLQRCNLTPREKRHSIMAQQDKKAILAKMRERQQQRGAAPKPSPKAETTSTKSTSTNGRRPNLQAVPDPTPAKVKAAQEEAEEVVEEMDEEDEELAAAQAALEAAKRRAAAKKEAEAKAAKKAAEEAKRPPMNPPEQPSEEEATSGDVNEEVDGRETGTTKRGGRPPKAKGFVVDDQRTARLLLVMAAIIKGEVSYKEADDWVQEIYE